MGKGRLPTNAMRGSPSCMGKGQGSLANEGTLYPDCLQVPRSIPGLPSGTQEYTRTASRAEAESEVPLGRVGGAQLQSL